MHIQREARRKVLIRARMRAGGLPTDVCIRDVSSRGMLIQAAHAPQRGTYVEIACERQHIAGRVIWSKDRRFGIQTRERIDIHALLHRLPAAVPHATHRPQPRRLAGHGLALGVPRMAGKAMEFTALGLFAAALVAALGASAFDALAQPFGTVTAVLAR